MENEHNAAAKKFNRRKGTAGVGGQLYEIKLVMLFLLEAERRKQLKTINTFHLASNKEEAQSFDDVVFTYQYTDTNGKEKTSIIFIQAKHKDNEEKKSSKINIDTLLSENGKFSLREYLSSFIKIKQLFSQSSNDPIFKGKLEDCEFILYTNAAFDFEKNRGNAYREYTDQEHFLNTTPHKNYYYKLVDTEEVKDILKNSLDYEILAKVVAQSITSKCVDMNKPVIKYYHNYLAETIIERTNKREGVIRDSFFDDQLLAFATLRNLKQHKHFSELSHDHLKNLLLEYRIQLPEKFGIVTENDLKLPPQQFISDEEIQLFLAKLKIFTDQPNENDLTEIIKKKIRMIYRMDHKDMIFLNLQHKVLCWWRSGGQYLTENNTFVQDSAMFPLYFGVKLPTKLFAGRKQELGRLHHSMQRSANKVTVISQMTTICGLGGIGKTELARQYIKEYSEHYHNNIIWINAESDTTLAQSFFKLADQLKISTKTMDGEKKDTESIVEEIYQCFSNRKSLFVFDNVENCDNFINILQIHSLKCFGNRPYLLITSRNRDWDKDIEVIDLNIFNVKDAVELVKSGLDAIDSSKDDEIETLVKKLQCFPLAIRQAVAYIANESRTSEEYTIADYLKEFDNNAKDLLNFKRSKEIDNDYAKTTYTTWKTTINKISQEDCGKMAIKLLNMMAFIANENISREMFLKFANFKKKQLKLSIDLLVKYSMINSDQKQSMLNIHKLVQEVVRLEVTEQNEELDVIDEVCKVLTNYFPYGSLNMTDLAKKRQLLPHIEMLVCHMDHYCYNDRATFLQKMLDLLHEGYKHFDNKNEKIVLDRLLRMNIKNYGLYNFNTVRVMIDLSVTNRKLGDYRTQKKLLEQALKIQQTFHVSNDLLCASILAHLGEAYGNLGNHNTEKEMLEKALNLQEKQYGSDHLNTATILAQLANAYWKLGDVMTQKELLEKALKIDERRYGRDHIHTASILSNLATAHGYLGDLFKQKELLERAFNIQTNFYSHDYQMTAYLMNLGTVYGKLGELEKAKEMLKKALILCENHYGSDHFETHKILANLAVVSNQSGELDQAKRLLEKALMLAEKYYGPQHFELAPILINLGDIYGEFGDVHEQKIISERALELSENHYGTDHFEVGHMLLTISTIYYTLGDLETQKQLLERALKIYERHYGCNHYEVVDILINLSEVYGQLGDAMKHKQLLRTAFETYQSRYDTSHFKAYEILTKLGLGYCNCGELSKGKELVEKSLKLVENLSHDFGKCDALVTLADAYLILGNPHKQIELLEKALAVSQSLYGTDHYRTTKVLFILGIAYGNIGNPNKHQELAERALKIQDQHFGSDNLVVALTLINLAVSYGSLNDIHKQKELSTKALNIIKLKYSDEKFYQEIETLINLRGAFGKWFQLCTLMNRFG